MDDISRKNFIAIQEAHKHLSALAHENKETIVNLNNKITQLQQELIGLRTEMFRMLANRG